MTTRELDEWVILRGIDGAPIIDASADFAPAHYLIHEWREYAVHPKEGAPHRGQIELVGLPARRLPFGGGVLFSFQNQLGLARLEVRVGRSSIPLTLEVLSQKYPSAEEHRAFYNPLVRQLSEYAATLPFALETPTELRVRESTRPPSDLFAWHFLRSHAGEILAALRIVLREPRRFLVSVDRDTDIDRASVVGMDQIAEVIARPADLQAVTAGRAYHWGLARTLEHRPTGRRFLPTRLQISQAEETLDTPEHRFVRAFLEEISNTIGRLQTRDELPEDGRKELKASYGEILEALHSSFLAEVGPMTVFPSTSRILRRAYGYRKLLDAWRAFHLSAVPFDLLEHALDARDVATLYEWWCFYELVARIGQLKPRVAVTLDLVDEFVGLRRGIRVRFSEGWDLVFNRPFHRGRGDWRSYSLGLRPDFVLAHDGTPVVALDAKFRFDVGDWEAAGESEDGAEPIFAAQLDRIDASQYRLAKTADIYKMHTYRDALGLRAAIVVYPGREGDTAPFFAAGGDGPALCTLASLLEDPPPIGVGAFPMSPES